MENKRKTEIEEAIIQLDEAIDELGEYTSDDLGYGILQINTAWKTLKTLIEEEIDESE